MIKFLVLFGYLFVNNVFATSTSLTAICAALPSHWLPTLAYEEFIVGNTFTGITEYSKLLMAGIGSYGYDANIIGVPVAAMPLPFMFMSYEPKVCNTYCNPLCSRIVEVTNIQTGQSIRCLITDTAATNNNALVISEDGYLAIGGVVADGRANITFRIVNA